MIGNLWDCSYLCYWCITHRKSQTRRKLLYCYQIVCVLWCQLSVLYCTVTPSQPFPGWCYQDYQVVVRIRERFKNLKVTSKRPAPFTVSQKKLRTQKTWSNWNRNQWTLLFQNEDTVFNCFLPSKWQFHKVCQFVNLPP